MKNYLNLIRCLASILFVFVCIAVKAQDKSIEKDDKEGDDAQQVLDKLANPAAAIGAMISLVDFQFYSGSLMNSTQSGIRYTFQPSLPVPLKNGVNMFIRPLIPINIKQPVYDESGFSNAGFDLGDISIDLAFGKTFNNKWVTVGGIFASLPTATDDRIGLHQVLLGPEAAYGRLGKWGSATLLLTYGWSITNNEERGNTSVMGGQYMYNINIGNAWQISGYPTFSYIPKASSGNKLAFPLGTGVKKVVVVGQTAVALGMQYHYYIVRPDAFALAHQIRILISPIVELPW
ncbi:hypothetical protein DFQ04_1111 [Algoriphagus boseongensis]|uniref:Outer membrane beta-barrel porin/alpha-amylase n=1 Tax=Algoriphagus boseongensis TaxID=1442587 RepID=A0A4R6T8F5_9BACT|nr:hypothetical protein [Algoriphagus boseongensis]TDQ19290.1 hypothetical protein DFQ04_1111 [Algoriphagus boseongensis]